MEMPNKSKTSGEYTQYSFSSEEGKDAYKDRRGKGKQIGYVIAIVMILVCAAIVIGFAVMQMQKQKTGIFRPDIETVKDSVVMIEVYDKNNELLGTGSGFCAYRDNWIVTNFHVIEGARWITVITDDGRAIDVTAINRFNKANDLAVLQIEGRLSPLRLGDGNDICVKDPVTAIGSPMGERNTVSEGIISNADDNKEIRISVPISHGSSGGVLLDENYHVIGITSAGYDEAQNLNFAINISVLEELCANQKADNIVFMDELLLYNHLGSLDKFNEYLPSRNKCYCVSSMEVFYNLTNDKARFEKLLSSKSDSWFNIYAALTEEEQETVVNLFMELNDYEFSDHNVAHEIEGWGATEFFISLEILDRYEYAITVLDISNYINEDMLFDHIGDNYPLDAAEKTLILYLIGGYDWSDIHADNKRDIFDYFDAKYGTEDLGAILEALGYEVVYEDDGTLTAYW